MKLLTAIFQSHHLDIVRDDLAKAGFSQMTIAFVRGSGVSEGTTATYRGNIYKDEFSDCVEMMLALKEEEVAKVMDVMKNSLKQANGVLWVQEIENFIHFKEIQ